MKQVRVWLEDGEAKVLAAEAKKRGISISQAGRERMFSPADAGDLEIYRAEQKEAFERLIGLLCDLVAGQKLGLNIANESYRWLNRKNSQEVIQNLFADYERLKKEARENV